MQKDFMAMAQGQQKGPQITEEELKDSMLSKEDLETLGMPSGEDEESIKARFMQLFQEAGLMEMFQAPAEKQKFTQLLNELAASLMSQDLEAVMANPLYQLLEKTMEASQDEVLSDEEAPAQQAAPTDFASMMPPGGGMGGR